MEEIKDSTNKQKDTPCSGLEEIMFSNWLYYSKHSTNSMQLPMVFFTEVDQKYFKFVWEQRQPPKAKAIFRMKNRPGKIRLPDFRL